MVRTSRRGASPRGPGQPQTRLDRWLNAAVSLAVTAALVVGSAAVLAHWLL